MPDTKPQIIVSSADDMARYGPSWAMLDQYGGDLGAIRPVAEVNTKGRKTGRVYICLATNEKTKDGKIKYAKKYITNTPAFLRRDDWIQYGDAVNWQAKTRLQAYADARAEVPYSFSNALGKSSVERVIADGNADVTVSFDGIRRGERSKPTQDKVFFPLPIIHSDNSWTARQLLVSKNSNLPLDLTNLRLATRGVAEVVEAFTIGTQSYTEFNGTLYGFTNLPSRSTKVMTSPLTSGYAPTTTVTEVISMIQTLYNNKFYGPYVLYYSNGWKTYFESDYAASGVASVADSLRSRLGKIEDIRKYRNIDGLTDYTMILVQYDPNYIEAFQGYPITPVQWAMPGEQEYCIKVWCMQYCFMRPDFAGHAPIVHGVGSLGGTTTTTTTTTTTSTTTTSTTTT